MIDKKKTFEIRQGDGSFVSKVQIESVKCKKNSTQAHLIVKDILQNLSLNPIIYACQPNEGFENLVVKHDGEKWILVFTSLINQNENPT